MNRKIIVFVVYLTAWFTVGMAGAQAAPPRTERPPRMLREHARPHPETPMPATMSVDYFRVWR